MQKNIHLYKYRNSQKLTTKEAANFMRFFNLKNLKHNKCLRTETANAIRNSPYLVNSLIAGVDPEEGPALYWLDYLGTLQKITRGAHGYVLNIKFLIFF